MQNQKLHRFDKFLRTALFIDKASNYGPEIFAPIYKCWQSYSESGEELCLSNKEIISTLLNKESFLYNIFWESYAESWIQNLELITPFDLNDIIKILQTLKRSKNPVLSKFEEFLKSNGILAKVTNQNIGYPLQSEISLGHKYRVCLDNHTLSKIIEENYNVVLHSFLALQGLSPDKSLETDSDHINLSKSQEEYLKSLSLIEENAEKNQVNFWTSESIDDFEKVKNYFKKRKINFRVDLGEEVQDLEAKIEKDWPIHVNQLKRLIISLGKFIKTLEKAIDVPPDPIRPLFGLNTIMESKFKIFSDNLDETKGKRYEDLLLGLHSFNCEARGENFSNNIYEIANKENMRRNLSLMQESLYEIDGNAYASIFIGALNYLKDALYARLKFLRGFNLTPKDIALLCELSTEKTVTNELTRESSSLKEYKKTKFEMKLSSYSERLIIWESFLKWGEKPRKHQIQWPSVVSKKSKTKIEDIEETVAFFNSFFDRHQKNSSKPIKKFLKSTPKQTKYFSHAEKKKIIEALQLNTNIGNKKAKELRDKFFKMNKETFLNFEKERSF